MGAASSIAIACAVADVQRRSTSPARTSDRRSTRGMDRESLRTCGCPRRRSSVPSPGNSRSSRSAMILSTRRWTLRDDYALGCRRMSLKHAAAFSQSELRETDLHNPCLATHSLDLFIRSPARLCAICVSDRSIAGAARQRSNCRMAARPASMRAARSRTASSCRSSGHWSIISTISFQRLSDRRSRIMVWLSGCEAASSSGKGSATSRHACCGAAPPLRWSPGATISRQTYAKDQGDRHRRRARRR